VREVKVGRAFKRYWRLRIPRELRVGSPFIVIEAGGERWQVSTDKHGRVYVPIKLRPMLEKAKTLVMKKEDDTLVIKPLSF